MSVLKYKCSEFSYLRTLQKHLEYCNLVLFDKCTNC